MLTELGKILRNIRFNHGWILKDMSDALNMSPSALSAIENGKALPSYDLATNIAERMEITVYEKNEIQICVEFELQSKLINILERSTENYFKELKEEENESNNWWQAI